MAMEEGEPSIVVSLVGMKRPLADEAEDVTGAEASRGRWSCSCMDRGRDERESDLGVSRGAEVMDAG